MTRRGGRRLDLAELAGDHVDDDPTAPTTATEASTVSTADVALNPLNPREDADLWDDDFERVVATVREHGVLQPIVVCTTEAFVQRYPDQADALRGARWVALMGNRRLAAARSLELDRVPAVVNDERVQTMWEVMLVENGQRRALGPIREAEAMQQVLRETGMTTRDLGERIGRTHAYISQRMALLGLIPALRRELENGGIKLELARKLGALPSHQQEVIVDAGPPFLLRPRPSGNAVTRRPRTFKASTPAAAAESIGELFSPAELDELVQLLIARRDAVGPDTA